MGKEDKTFENYINLRETLFENAEKIKDTINVQGFDVGEIVDCAPLASFRCKNCGSDKVAIYIFKNAVVLVCYGCNLTEVIGY